MNAAETLRRAVEIAEELGHCKGHLIDSDGDGKAIACCILGATVLARNEAADRGEPTPHDMFDLVEKAIGMRVARWNDKPEITKEDVVQALKRAVQIAEERGV